MNNMIFIAHRINTINELKQIPIKYGVEIDLRNNGNDIILSHEPFFNNCELFEEYLKFYSHKFLILNVKTEGIEYKILELLIKYNIKDYFFLDCSFPMIYKLINLGEPNIALRFSEFESIETILTLKNKVKWVWIDCFSKLPYTPQIDKLLKNNNFSICLVSPELQNQENKIELYKNQINKSNIFSNMICTKINNIKKWL
jgi:hypothetical protein